VALYRKFGYEIAGTRFSIALNPARITLIDRTCTVRPFEERDQPLVEEVYRQWATTADGNIDRNAYLWHRVRHPRGENARGFVIDFDGRVEGYVFYVQGRESDSHRQHLAITDMGVSTPRAARRLLTFFGDHRSMVKRVAWFSGPADPLLALLPEQSYEQRLDINWMVRVLDIERALTARGYPPAVSAELHLDIDDAMFQSNRGRFVLSVAEGKGHVAAGGQGRIKLGERALACLYTGYRSPRELRGIGWLTGEDSDIDLASAVFCGPLPWMRDQF
jgi:predicted acetyltransferase